MKHNFNQQLAILLFSVLLSACGASKKSTATADGSGEFGSRDPITDNNNNTSNTPVGYYALCNSFANQEMNGVVTSYINPMTNKLEEEIIRLQLKKEPTAIKDNADFYLQIFRWSEETEGSVYINPTATDIFFLHENGTYLSQTPVNSISKTTVEEAISNSSVEGLTLANFFSKVIVILNGVDLKYDAIMINTYNSAAGTQALSSIDVLVPAFAADPNIYAETHPTGLLELHPNYSIMDNGFEEWQYYEETQAMCN